MATLSACRWWEDTDVDVGHSAGVVGVGVGDVDEGVASAGVEVSATASSAMASEMSMVKVQVAVGGSDVYSVVLTRRGHGKSRYGIAYKGVLEWAIYHSPGDGVQG